MSADPIYEPTEAEIRRACLEIQKEWSVDEEYHRRTNSRKEPYELTPKKRAKLCS